MKSKALFTWSGGKDSTCALYTLVKQNQYEIVGLLTTLTEGYERVSIHGVREELLDAQAQALCMPLKKVFIPQQSSNDIYEARMYEVLSQYKEQGIFHVVFGDIFLEDLRKYREENLAKLELSALFPIWKKDTKKLAHSFVTTSFKAIVTCVDTEVLDRSFCGREFDETFVRDLPSNVDPCGENGEFHSFVYDGPLFKEKIVCATGEKVLRDNRFYYCDLVSEKKCNDEAK